MEIILSKKCEALVGSLGKGYGYYIRRARHQDGSVHFFSQRSKWDVPADGHLRFIFACAELAQMKTHIADIRVSRKELIYALWEADYETAGDYVYTEPGKFPKIFSASDIINYRREYLPNQA
jgi:hypothetical protein